MSIEVSQRSLVVPHGQAEAAAKVKSKPKFAEYMCTPYEVREWRLRFFGVIQIGSTDTFDNQVESFVQVVVQKTIPRDFWGSKENEGLILDRTSLSTPSSTVQFWLLVFETL